MQAIASNSGTRSGYMPQLDGLRTLAVFSVLVHHFMNVESLPWRFLHLPWGHLGVRLFFVLSGFLITGILLDCRNNRDAGGRLFSLRQFYVRRMLRIFPLYYAVICAAFIADIPPVRDVFGWLLTYTTNFYVARQGDWLPQVGHLWTLAVEEQFYLVWPWLILFTPRRALAPLIVGCILVGPAFRFVAVVNDFNSVAIHAVTFASMDSLGMGSLLAVATRALSPRQLQKVLGNVILPCGIVIMLAAHVASYSGKLINTVALDFALGLVFCWIVFRASSGFSGWTGSILQSKPFVYLGRISYGIYVYHFFVPYFLWPILNRLSLTSMEWQLLSFSIGATLTICIAAVSWHCFERPVNRLKKFAEYKRPALKPLSVNSSATA